ncbi:hypothetical protein [Bradyrhizobium sp. JYMT SZCCT0428]|uniref:hypothetical protein n=1 Tax=Bradyrhizobium sp. JYMT SZCCT0428 TaxID=2807673 RepID=UPI001BAC53E0|nr:hypothetical protein [Bradyrhizobium sp. JYMT SZCCT0428]MBR1157032.1 hypothetical protein [Bradyrhizobium sp. JYMT SZCCT0428]
MRAAPTLTISAALLFASPCHAGASHPCIPKATDALPPTAGLVVKQARIRPVSAEVLSTWKGQTLPIMIDVDFVAADEKYSFLCVVTQGSPFVQRAMN